MRSILFAMYEINESSEIDFSEGPEPTTGSGNAAFDYFADMQATLPDLAQLKQWPLSFNAGTLKFVCRPADRAPIQPAETFHREHSTDYPISPRKYIRYLEN